jgi:hypothetical protein
MTTLSYDELHDELWRVEEAFIRILGKKPLYVSFLTLPGMLGTISVNPKFQSQHIRVDVTLVLFSIALPFLCTLRLLI